MTTFRTDISPKGCIDIKAVAKMLGIVVTSAWALVKQQHDFPKKVKFGAREAAVLDVPTLRLVGLYYGRHTADRVLISIG